MARGEIETPAGVEWADKTLLWLVQRKSVSAAPLICEHLKWLVEHPWDNGEPAEQRADLPSAALVGLGDDAIPAVLEKFSQAPASTEGERLRNCLGTVIWVMTIVPEGSGQWESWDALGGTIWMTIGERLEDAGVDRGDYKFHEWDPDTFPGFEASLRLLLKTGRLSDSARQGAVELLERMQSGKKVFR